MLVDMANGFENGEFKGLFQFLKYIDKNKIANSKYGEANVINSDDNVVRVMTMHKSKGLEFPVVFVSRLHRRLIN